MYRTAVDQIQQLYSKSLSLLHFMDHKTHFKFIFFEKLIVPVCLMHGLDIGNALLPLKY